MNVYLAGPIAGNTTDEANDWRSKADNILAQDDIFGISPLRTEPVPDGDVYPLSVEHDALWGKTTAIAAKNRFDMDRCDITIAYLPDLHYLHFEHDKTAYGKLPSIGTMMELGYLKGIGKPSVVWTTEPYYINHPLVSSFADWIVPTLEQACELCEGLHRGYS